jgi:hypothetical protein
MGANLNSSGHLTGNWGIFVEGLGQIDHLFCAKKCAQSYLCFVVYAIYGCIYTLKTCLPYLDKLEQLILGRREY